MGLWENIMALWKRGRRYWTYFSVNGIQLRRPLCPEGSTRATTNWQEALRLEKEMIRAAMEGELAPRDPSVKLFAAIDDYLEAKKATANSERTIEFDRERLEIVKRHLGDVKLSTITRKVIESFQAKRRLEGSSNRTINMDVGALRQVLRRFKQWRRLEDDVKMLTEAGGAPVGRALTPAEQKRLFEAAASNPEWEHVYCAAVLAANTSMRGVEVKHVRRRNIDLQKVWDVESATGKGVLYVTRSKNETSKRPIPLNQAARGAVERMLKRADDLGHTDPEHYVWCASQHHKYDPTKPASQWNGAWRSLRKAAGLPGFRFHDLRHTVVTDLLEAGEPDHVIQAVTGQLSKKMLEHYSHQRLKAKGQMLTRMEERRKKKESA
jgi:integrase